MDCYHTDALTVESIKHIFDRSNKHFTEEEIRNMLLDCGVKDTVISIGYDYFKQIVKTGMIF